MAWMQKLYDTYERCAGSNLPDAKALLPIAHTTQQAHIEIVIDGEGNFRRAMVIPKDDQETLIPCTEDSAGRAGIKPATHPLCDNLQYVAKDFRTYGGTVTSGYAKIPGAPCADYMDLLEGWTTFAPSQTKLMAISAYVGRGNVIADLVGAGILPLIDPVADPPLLLKEWTGQEEAPEIFRRLPNGQAPEDAFIRWRVESDGELATGTWEDVDLVRSWQDFYASRQSVVGLCQVDGRIAALAEQHPKKLRHSADRAKLISANDTSGFTFLGRFTNAAQAAGVSFEVTQKAHSALRWLIGRKQAARSGDQVFVAWAVNGQSIPDPWADTMDILNEDQHQNAPDPLSPTAEVGDVGQEFSRRLQRAIAGYRSNLSDTDDVVVMGLDSATTGRLAITFYREIKGSEFLVRIQTWHDVLAWPQNFGKETKFVGAPAPRDIAEAAYGRRLDDKLKKATVERLLPCIVDGLSIPIDLVTSCCRRVFNRPGLEPWEWEKCLGIACALYKGFHKERGYSMALQEDRKTRDYLYGRLLAAAEHLESRALYVAGENRDTTAARLLQRFADHPYSTWRTIELSLTPYKARLRNSRAGFLWNMEKLLDQLLGAFSPQDEKEAFTNDRPLSGEFLLGYHCQRQALRHEPEDTESTPATAE